MSDYETTRRAVIREREIEARVRAMEAHQIVALIHELEDALKSAAQTIAAELDFERVAERLGIPAATLRGLRDGSLVAVPVEPSEAILDAGADAHGEAWAVERGRAASNGRVPGLAPCQWLPSVWAAMLEAAQEPRHD